MKVLSLEVITELENELKKDKRSLLSVDSANGNIYRCRYISVDEDCGCFGKEIEISINEG